MSDPGIEESEDLWNFAEHRWKQGNVALAIAVFFWVCALVLAFVDIPSSWIALGGAMLFSWLGFSTWESSLKMQDTANVMLTVAVLRRAL